MKPFTFHNIRGKTYFFRQLFSIFLQKSDRNCSTLCKVMREKRRLRQPKSAVDVSSAAQVAVDLRRQITSVDFRAFPSMSRSFRGYFLHLRTFYDQNKFENFGQKSQSETCIQNPKNPYFSTNVDFWAFSSISRTSWGYF